MAQAAAAVLVQLEIMELVVVLEIMAVLAEQV
jgi:hypothetical protein